jgi:hypothetical protein
MPSPIHLHTVADLLARHRHRLDGMAATRGVNGYRQ